jgi:hypothetical protein
MRKLAFLFIAAIALTSCSNDNDTIAIAVPKTLQKVVFYKNSINERHWNISNNLLTNITLADGTIAEEFTYDNLKRVIKDVKYTNGIVTETNVITYNTDSTIQSINGLPYTYNAATQTYLYTYGSNFTINCKVNENKLAIDFVRTGVGASEYHMTYADGNMLSFEKVTNGAIETVKNFHFSGNIAEAGPVYKAILAVARVKSLTDPNFFVDCQVSKMNPDGFDKGTTDPYYYNYGAIPDMEGKLLQIGIEVLDNHNNPVSYYPFADYYYE